jgi:hypothetical protein
MKQRTYLIIFVKQTTYLITLPDRSPASEKFQKIRGTEDKGEMKIRGQIAQPLCECSLSPERTMNQYLHSAHEADQSQKYATTTEWSIQAIRDASTHDCVADIFAVPHVFAIVVGASYQTLARFSRL